MIATVVGDVVRAFARTLQAPADRDPALTGFLAAVQSIDPLRARAHADLPVAHPALHVLPRAMANLRVAPDLASAIARAMPHLRWSSTYPDDGVGARLARGMAWSELAGRGALVERSDMRLGCFLLTPGLTYPLHGHEANEVYFVASGALTITHGYDGAHWMVEAPGYSITPSGLAHALTVGPEPALLIYVWTGDLVTKAWWCRRAADGTWVKDPPDQVPQ